MTIDDTRRSLSPNDRGLAMLTAAHDELRKHLDELRTELRADKALTPEAREVLREASRGWEAALERQAAVILRLPAQLKRYDED